MRRGAAFVVALVLLVGGACSSQPAMTRADARTFTTHALRHIGLTDIRVSPVVTAGRYHSNDTRFARDVDVWQTGSDVRGGIVTLLVQRKGDNAVFVRDSTADGRLLLTEAQVRQLDRYRFDPVAERRRRSHLPWGVAALVLVLGMAVLLAVGVSRRSHTGRA